MHELSHLAQPLVDRPPAPPPDLAGLRQRGARLRRRRLTAWGVGVAAILSVVAIGVDLLFLEPPPLEVAAGDHAAAPVPTLTATGPQTVVASGTLADGTGYEMVAYRVAPAEGRVEPRICTELRSTVDGPQSCFPVVADPSAGIRWSFTERHLGALFLVVATDPGVVPKLDGLPLEPQSGQDGLAVRFSVTILPEGDGTAWLSDPSSGSGSAINLDSPAFAMAASGARMPYSSPTVSGVFFERLTSDNPGGDGWIGISGPDGRIVGYLNPSDFYAPPLLPDPQTGLRQDEQPDPVYDGSGRRVAWTVDGCVYTLDPDAECEGPSPTSLGDPAG